MQKTLKLEDVLDPQFNAALIAILDKELKAKTAYRLSKIFKKVQEERKNFEEFRQEMLKKHAVLKEDGELDLEEDGTVKFESDEKKQEFFDEINNLKEEEEVELTVVEVAQINVDLSPKVMIHLDKILV